MNSIEIPKQTDQKKWKQLFEGSLNRLNGREVPASQQPICRVKRPNVTPESDYKAAITAAADSLAALWQISTPRRQGI
ncbi:MAG: hypothetical protein ABSF97_10385 [Candidatus Sulfotelmatobacter sp.]|jgi:hypothetical protein